MWWIVVDFWWISGGSGRHVVDCGGFLVDFWQIWWTSGGLWWIVVDF